jgi:hypothetical protein
MSSRDQVPPLSAVGDGDQTKPSFEHCRRLDLGWRPQHSSQRNPVVLIQVDHRTARKVAFGTGRPDFKFGRIAGRQHQRQQAGAWVEAVPPNRYRVPSHPLAERLAPQATVVELHLVEAALEVCGHTSDHSQPS